MCAFTVHRTMFSVTAQYSTQLKKKYICNKNKTIQTCKMINYLTKQKIQITIYNCVGLA